MRYFTLMMGTLLVSGTALSLDAPHIGSGAHLTADIGGKTQDIGATSYAGVVNALGDVSGKSTVVQNLAHIGDASVGSNAKIALSVKNAGVANALGAFEGAAVVNQSIASVSGGDVGSNLTLDTSIENAGVVNVVGGIGGLAKICQSIGSIGNNCKEKPIGD
tara:strand:- start:2772 stop:3257 length:486 start_codon:yes stop_codon:yes gene_type:complete